MIGWFLAKGAAKVYTAPIWVIPYSVKKGKRRKCRHRRRCRCR